MNTTLQQAKSVVWRAVRELEASPSLATCRSLLSPDSQWVVAHPVNELLGPDAVAERLLAPLRRALPDAERRIDLFFAGYWDGRIDGGAGTWVTCTGHYLGRFREPLWGIEPTGEPAWLRFGEFYRVEGEHIVEARILLDLVDLARQAGRRILPPSSGLELLVPGSRHASGILLAPQDAARGEASLRLVEDMIGGLSPLWAEFPPRRSRCWSRLAHHWPVLGDLWRRFAAPPVRHAGTLAGNVANGSPIGDGPPVLMALQARLVLRRGQERRTVPLDAFYRGYQRNELQAGEFIEWIEVPLPAAGQVLRAWKISKRYDSDISAVCGAFGLRLAPPAGPGTEATAAEVSDVVLAFGGLAATVRRAAAAEQALRAQGWCETGIQAAQAALEQDFQPLSDLRASADYRLEVARSLLQRLWLSTRPQATTLEVWR